MVVKIKCNTKKFTVVITLTKPFHINNLKVRWMIFAMYNFKLCMKYYKLSKLHNLGWFGIHNLLAKLCQVLLINTI